MGWAAAGSHGDLASIGSSTLEDKQAQNLRASETTAESVKLTWDNPSRYNVTGYKLQRRTGNSGSFTTLQDVSTRSTGFTDTTVSASTTYTCRVIIKYIPSGEITVRLPDAPAFVPTAPTNFSLTTGRYGSALTAKGSWDQVYEAPAYIVQWKSGNLDYNTPATGNRSLVNTWSGPRMLRADGNDQGNPAWHKFHSRQNSQFPDFIEDLGFTWNKTYTMRIGMCLTTDLDLDDVAFASEPPLRPLWSPDRPGSTRRATRRGTVLREVAQELAAQRAAGPIRPASNQKNLRPINWRQVEPVRRSLVNKWNLDNQRCPAPPAIRAMGAGPFLVAALCLAGALVVFLAYPAYARSGDETSAPSNLTAAIADSGVILNWSPPVQDAASVTGYEILRRRPKVSDGTPPALAADTGSTATTYLDATANEPGTRYVYRVKALRGSEKSPRSNYARVDLPEEADETEPAPGPAPRGVTVHTSGAQSGDPCPEGDDDPTPTEIAVSSVPIVVTSTTDDYFVLYANVGGNDIPVQVKRGESGTTTLEENIEALPASDYRVEKYAVADPADVDRDCLDDLADPSPLNHSHRLELDPEDGAMMIANHARFEELANAGVVKFVLVEVASSMPEIYFQNTVKYFRHTPFAALLRIDGGKTIWVPAEIKYDSNILLNGNEGVYYYTLNHEYTSSQIERIHTLLAANLPVVDHNLAYSRGGSTGCRVIGSMLRTPEFPWWMTGLSSVTSALAH